MDQFTESVTRLEKIRDDMLICKQVLIDLNKDLRSLNENHKLINKDLRSLIETLKKNQRRLDKAADDEDTTETLASSSSSSSSHTPFLDGDEIHRVHADLSTIKVKIDILWQDWRERWRQSCG